jgi:hypothetical protein
MAVAYRVLVIAYQAAQTDLSEVRRAPDSLHSLSRIHAAAGSRTPGKHLPPMRPLGHSLYPSTHQTTATSKIYSPNVINNFGL